MEEFIIKNTSPDNALDVYKVLWKIHSAKSQKSILILLLFCLALLVIGIFTHNKYNLVSNGHTRIYYNLNLFLSFGAAGTVLFFYCFRIFRKSRKNYLKRAADYIRRFEDVKGFHLELSEEFIVFNETLAYYKIDWHLFQSKFYEERLIFLNRSDSSVDCIPIDARSLTDEEFERLTSFISRKIPSTHK